MQEIAKAGQGSYVFIRDEEDVAPSFGEIIGGLLTTAAQNIEVLLEPANGARIISVEGGDVSPSASAWK